MSSLVQADENEARFVRKSDSGHADAVVDEQRLLRTDATCEDVGEDVGAKASVAERRGAKQVWKVVSASSWLRNDAQPVVMSAGIRDAAATAVEDDAALELVLVDELELFPDATPSKAQEINERNAICCIAMLLFLKRA